MINTHNPNDIKNSSSPEAQTLQTLASTLAQLQNQVASLQQQLAATAASQSLLPTPEPASVLELTPNSRRRFLKRWGTVAAGVSALGVASTVASTQSAQAASGDNMLLGNSNFASHTTYLSQTNNVTNLDKKAVLWADWNPTTSSTAPAVNAALAGTAEATDGIGGFFSGTQAPLLLKPAAASGAPTGTHSRGELFVDSLGSIYICVNNSPLTWRKIAGSDTYSLHLFNSPDRFLDTRITNGQGQTISPIPANLASQLSPGTLSAAGITVTSDLSVDLADTGSRDITNKIPLGARGIFGAAYIVSSTSGAIAKFFPATASGTTAVSTVIATVANVSNVAPLCLPFTSPSGGGRSIKFNVSQANTAHLIVDLFGYFL